MSTSTSISFVVTTILFVSICNLPTSSGHGYLEIPKPRQVLHSGGSQNVYGFVKLFLFRLKMVFQLFFLLHRTGDKQSLNGGGKGDEMVKGHGLCGDNPDRNLFEAPNLYGPSFPTVATYTQGQYIDITVKLTAHHYGWFEFRLCRNPDGGLDTTKPSTQDCFNENILSFDPVATANSYVGQMRPNSGLKSPADYGGGTSFYSWEHSKCPYLIPGSPVGSCCNGGGTCSPPTANTDRWVIPEPTPGSGSYTTQTYTMRYKLPDSVVCPRCVLQWYYQTGNSPDGYPEGFWNCADITIEASNTVPVTPTTAVTTKPSQKSPTQVPNSKTAQPSTKPTSAQPRKNLPTQIPSVKKSVTPSVIPPPSSKSPLAQTANPTSGTVTACGKNAFWCTGTDNDPVFQPVIPGVVVAGGLCCCNWGYKPLINADCTNLPVAQPTSAPRGSHSPTLKTASAVPSKSIVSPVSKPPTASPTTAVTKSKPSTTAAPTNSPRASPTVIRRPSSVPTTSPSRVVSTTRTSSFPTIAPSAVAATANPTSGGVLTVTACGASAFWCTGTDNDPVFQPVIPGVVVAGGLCCCNWGYKPLINADCTNLPVAQPTSAPRGSHFPTRTAIPTKSFSPTYSSAPATVSYIGWYKWTWLSGTAPAGMNLAVAFSGWASVASALSASAATYPSLKGLKFLSIGGGNENGHMTTAVLTELDTAVSNGQLSGYDGVCYDVEEGDANLGTAFAASFANTKAKKLMVLVTISHSAPYGITDKVALMNGFFADSNIDILSPQLYTSGRELENDYTTSGVPWSSFANAKAAVVPSIVSASYYSDAQNFFATTSRSGTSFNTKGFIQWKQ